MTRIYELNGWPNVTWDSTALAGILAAVRHKQGRQLGDIQTLDLKFRVEAGLAARTDEVVNSWAIEGEIVDPLEARSSIASELGLDVTGLPMPGRAVRSAVGVMLDAIRTLSVPLTEHHLSSWHARMFSPWQIGLPAGWRTTKPEQCQCASNAFTTKKIEFEAPAADQVRTEMIAFLDWFNSPSAIDPVLKAGIALFWFVTIRPFEYGNGRIARMLTDMLLARADGTRERFYSISAGIEAERREYFCQLESVQHGSLDITPWLIWFLGCVDRAIDSADTMLDSLRDTERLWRPVCLSNINKRQRKVIKHMVGGLIENLTISGYAKFAKCSNNTARSDIRGILEKGIVEKDPGGGRGIRYRLADSNNVLVRLSQR